MLLTRVGVPGAALTGVPETGQYICKVSQQENYFLVVNSEHPEQAEWVFVLVSVSVLDTHTIQTLASCS